MSRFSPSYPIRSGYTVLPTPDRVRTSREITGRGVVMAFIDSGFYPHPDIADRVLVHVDATSSRIIEGRRYHTPEWYSWHGQMTSVIAAGAGADFPGIARDAQLVLIKVSTAQRQIKERDILRGLNWLLANHARFGVRVVNISVGGDFESHDPDHPLHHAIAQAVAAGLIVIVAAGNFPMPRLVPPASALDAITVGGFSDENSLDPRDWQPYSSSWGAAYDGTPKPEVIASARWIAAPILPGTRVARSAPWLLQLFGADEAAIRQVLREGYVDLGIPREKALRPDAALFADLETRLTKDKLIDAQYQHVDGTSVAAPIVAAVVAQMLEVRPHLTPGEVRAILTGTAERLSGIPVERQGSGLIQPARALEWMRSMA